MQSRLNQKSAQMGRNLTHKFPFWFMHKRKLPLPKVICRESKGKKKKGFPPFYSARASFQSPCADWFFSPTTRPKHRHTWRPTALKNGLFTLIQGRVLVCMAWREAVRGCAGVEHVGYARMEATVVENVGAWWC
ncbi:hypothetical protein ERO13_A06G179014v2 [Gossypium hirsutum]|uniref:Uncharacterized protein isoform X2 n=2 Tax=Gossypium TaxID=3633 RepID=A0ABM3BY92_GOSHI|nr:uncharacterized protein LOC121230758 isoform X2 [Gossypium hirsutum]KAG4196400.1 hypothetical protein ERO13_A06G179014v2 [Gossypium hirsutum]TYI23957.1 hypothetical protein ES332_A06G201200v1 [Gossypium tomentosum]